MGEFGKRVFGPFMLPFVSMLLIGVLVFSFSRILLAVPEIASTSLALLISAEILGVAAVVAAGTRIKPMQRGLLAVLALALIGGGGAAAGIGVRPIHHESEDVKVEVAAKDLKFDKQTLEVPVGGEAKLVFANNDAGIPHNVAIYTTKEATEAIFKGPVFPGIATQEYTIEPLEAGTYFFRCDVHPIDMVGDVVAGEGGGAGGGGGGHGQPTASATPTAGTASPSPTASASPSPATSPSPSEPAGGGASQSVSANGLEFDTDKIELPAETDVTIEFENKESAPHNVSIYREKGGENLFRGEVFPGPAKRTYTFTSPAAGTYYFQCDVHPDMNGEAIFS